MSCSGCHDTPLPLYNESPCESTFTIPSVPCTDGEPCEDVIKDICVEYTGPNLPCLGITTVVNNVHTPVRLDVIIASIERAICELQTSAGYISANCTVTSYIDTDNPGDYYQIFFDWTFVSGSTYDIKIYLDNTNTVVDSHTGLTLQSNPLYTDSNSVQHSYATPDISDKIISDQLYTYEITKYNSCGSTTCARQSFTPSFSYE